MNRIISLLTILIVGTMLSVPTVAVAKNKSSAAPWSTMSAQKKKVFTDKYKCPAATSRMSEVARWPIAKVTPVDKENVHTEIRVSPEAPYESAILVFLHKPGTKVPVIVMGMIPVGEELLVAVDFDTTSFLYEAEKLGRSKETIPFAEATRDTTGKYFCYLDI